MRNGEFRKNSMKNCTEKAVRGGGAYFEAPKQQNH